MRIARQLPSYGGAFKSGGALHVYLTNSAHEAAARQIIRQEISRGKGPQPPLIMRRGRFAYLQLEDWAVAARSLWTIPGVSWTGIDEAHNGIHVGIQRADVENALTAPLTALGIPIDAVRFEISQKPILLENLVDRVRPFRAGTRIQSIFNGRIRNACTYGASAVWRGHPGTYYLIMASHCTQDDPSQWGLVGANIYQSEAPLFQNDSANFFLGREFFDPQGSSPCTVEGQPVTSCRHSDAAFVQIYPVHFESDVDQGYVAKPAGSPVYLPSRSGTLAIDNFNPTIRIDAINMDLFVGDTVQKIGEKTGWTAGEVTDSCRDVGVVDDLNPNRIYGLLCSMVATMGSGSGDSGAPVIRLAPSGSYLMAGLLWGGAPPADASGNFAVMYASSWAWVSTDLAGDATALNPAVSGMVATVDGPDCIPQSGNYFYQANVTGGGPSYNYWWEIYTQIDNTWRHLGSDAAVFTYKPIGNVDRVDHLRVTVYSSASQITSPHLNIAVRLGSHLCPS